MLFLINLDSADARRRRMTSQLDALGLEYQRIGFDGRQRTRWDIADYVSRQFPGITFDCQRLSVAEIGCWISHMTAWHALLDAPDVPSCTVIEDDVILDRRFAETVRQLDQMRGFDLVYLGTSSRNISGRRKEALVPGLQLQRPIGAIFNTWGYVFGRAGCSALLRRLRVVRWPIDHVLGGRVRSFRLRLAVVQPAVLFEDPETGNQSQIEPLTYRLDRTRWIEGARRRLLASGVGDLYSCVYRLF
jgi:GR25 family glycosyltransferase involved in LPS biosynthesis